MTRAEAAALLPEWRVAEERPLLAASLEELQRLNAAAPTGELQRVGLYLIPAEFDASELQGIRVKNLPALAAELRKLEGLTVRGCRVRGNLRGVHGKALGKFFRACYQSAKAMSVTLPSTIPYLCAEGVLDALSCNAEAHPETLQEALTAARIVAAQNETAFYAKLFIV